MLNQNKRLDVSATAINPDWRRLTASGSFSRPGGFGLGDSGAITTLTQDEKRSSIIMLLKL